MAIDRDGHFNFVLAGGSSPRLTYELLSARGHLDWSRIHVFWSDERCVQPDDDASNYRMAATALFARTAPPTGNVHRIPAERGGLKAAAQYDDELGRFFGARQPGLMMQPSFDLVLLGIGDDGHTASLFSGGPGLTSPSWAAPARAPVGLSPAERVTLTLAGIVAAAEVLFIATGVAKRGVVARILSAEGRDLPAARVTAHQGVRWLLDREAGANLQ